MATTVNPSQTLEDVNRFVRRALGEGVVGVELEDEQVNDATTSALLWWQGIVGWYREATVNINPQGGDFDVPDDCQEVYQVHFDEPRDKILDVFDWAGVELAPVGYGSYFSTPSGAYSYILQWQDYIQQGQKIVSVDPDWQYIRDTRKLRIFGGNNRTEIGIGNQVHIVYMASSPDISKLHQYEYELVRKYALAESMVKLGAIRSKWISVPSSMGETTLNGDSLIANAETMKAELEEKAKQYRRPMEFFNY